MRQRKAGVLLHITSLPGKYGVGTLGSEAYQFVDWLKSAGMRIWQVLPLMPTNYGDSPYQSVSSTALNYYLIDFDILFNKGLLQKKEYVNERFTYNKDKVDFGILFEKKTKILRLAFDRFDRLDKEFVEYVESGVSRDFAVFMTIKALHSYNSWDQWSDEFKNYSYELECRVIEEYNDDYLFWVWTQFEFTKEWYLLHKYAKKNGIEIMGDMPLYVAYDSVEVWKHPELFYLHEDKRLKLMAGCPPDVFSVDGQLWGNPIYDWDYMKKNNYSWWNERIKSAFSFVDILRIDHFRGFSAYYGIPEGETTARNGQWYDGPGFDLFKDKTGLNIVAEDLGFIDDGVRNLLKATGYPGMKILEFAFDGDPENEHKPSNSTQNYIVYTGTHDNMPLYQYIVDLNSSELDRFKSDLKRECELQGIKANVKGYKTLVQSVIELAYASVPNLCIIPMQDILCQDGSTRMNLPSTVSTNNWSYRVKEKELSEELASMLAYLAKKYNR